MTSESLTRSTNSRIFLLLALITMMDPLPARSRAVIDWPLVAGDLTSTDVDGGRTVRSALSNPGSTSSDFEKTREPWQINQNICPPPLAHLCSSNVHIPGGETQSSFVTPFFEGDIVLNWEQRRDIGLANMRLRSSLRSRSRARPRRAIIKGSDHRWPDAIIPYTIDLDFNQEAVRRIRSAMRHWQQNTCIRFVPKESSHQDYLRFVYLPGCWSYIGRQGGEQLISMGPGCNVFSTIIHELGHAIGYWHEQSRQDRDKYIQVVERNIAQRFEENFNKIDTANVTSLGYPYDFESIMQYSATAFSATGKPTIRMKKKYRDLLPDVSAKLDRPSNELSELDIAQTRGMYGCNERVAKRQRKEPCIQSESGDGSEYRGDLYFTESGITCQRWTSQYPHEHGYVSEDESRNERRGIGHHNFCRNPGGRRERPWCFTTLKNTIWEYCDIKICPTS